VCRHSTAYASLLLAVLLATSLPHWRLCLPIAAQHTPEAKAEVGKPRCSPAHHNSVLGMAPGWAQRGRQYILELVYIRAPLPSSWGCHCDRRVHPYGQIAAQQHTQHPSHEHTHTSSSSTPQAFPMWPCPCSAWGPHLAARAHAPQRLLAATSKTTYNTCS
jgi:hypothetical protein